MRNLLIPFFISLFCVASSQSLKTLGTVNLGLNGISTSAELPVSKNLLSEISLGYGGGTSIVEGECTGYEFNSSSFAPFLRADLKYFYNRNSREEKGHRTDLNSGNYFSFQMKYSFGKRSDISMGEYLAPGINYGMKRAFGKNFTFDGYIGMVYLSDLNTKQSALLPNINLKIGYVIFGRNK